MYFWQHSKRYNDYSSYNKKIFSSRIQKISINAGFSCPNRDGTKSTGGCIYCQNKTFNPFYCEPQKSITTQIEEGIQFFAKKYHTQKYLAYFQSYTNTYADISVLKKMFLEALSHQAVIGIVVATRPDCVDVEKIEFLQELAEKYYVSVEYGTESTKNETLTLINRCHTFEETEKAVQMTALRNIKIGLHLILGLPKESKSDMIEHAKKISRLPVDTLKLHQLQIIKNTVMEKYFLQQSFDFQLFNADEYIDLVIDFLENLNPQIIVERFISESPMEMILAPRWNGLKNFEFVHKLEKRLEERNSWQGKNFFS